MTGCLFIAVAQLDQGGLTKRPAQELETGRKIPIDESHRHVDGWEPNLRSHDTAVGALAGKDAIFAKRRPLGIPSRVPGSCQRGKSADHAQYGGREYAKMGYYVNSTERNPASIPPAYSLFPHFLIIAPEFFVHPLRTILVKHLTTSILMYKGDLRLLKKEPN